MKPTSPTPSKIRGQQDRSRGTLRENKSPAVLCGSVARRRISIPMCDQSITCNPHWDIGPGRASLSGCIGLHLILYSIHRTATDRRLTMSHSNTPPVRNRHHDCTVKLFKVCICSRAPYCRTLLQNWQDKTPKASSKKRSIMEHSPGVPQDTNSLRSCSGNKSKMLL